MQAERELGRGWGFVEPYRLAAALSSDLSLLIRIIKSAFPFGIFIKIAGPVIIQLPDLSQQGLGTMLGYI